MTRASEATLPVSCPVCAGPFSGWHPMFTTAAVVKTAVGCPKCDRQWVVTTTLRPARAGDMLPALPPAVPVVVACEACTAEFTPERPERARFCSALCRKRAWHRQRTGAA